jgi:hypothetical protein
VEPPKPKASSASKPPRSREQRLPVKSAEDILLDQVQGLLDAARSDSGAAKGFADIEEALQQRDRRSASGVIATIRTILKQRDDRWAITKFIWRSTETQALYDNIGRLLGEPAEL